MVRVKYEYVDIFNEDEQKEKWEEDLKDEREKRIAEALCATLLCSFAHVRMIFRITCCTLLTFAANTAG